MAAWRSLSTIPPQVSRISGSVPRLRIRYARLPGAAGLPWGQGLKAAQLLVATSMGAWKSSRWAWMACSIRFNVAPLLVRFVVAPGVGGSASVGHLRERRHPSARIQAARWRCLSGAAMGPSGTIINAVAAEAGVAGRPWAFRSKGAPSAKPETGTLASNEPGRLETQAARWNFCCAVMAGTSCQSRCRRRVPSARRGSC